MATATQTTRAAAREMRGRAIPHTEEAAPPAVVWALARVEARKMLRHPAFLIGLGLWFVVTGGSPGSGYSLSILFLGLGLALMVGTLFAANLGALRSRRDGTDELFGSAPAPLGARTAAQLLGVVIGPVSVSIVWASVVAILHGAEIGGLPEDLEFLMLVQTPFVIAAIGALGVMIARWIPNVIGGVVVLALHTFTPLIWVIPWVVWHDDVALHLWHLAYLVSVTVAYSSAAFLRDRVRPVPVVIGAAGLAGAIAFGILQIPEGWF